MYTEVRRMPSPKPTTVVAVVLFVLMSVLIFVPGMAKADSTVAFTSTADFDAGTKSQPGSPDGNYQVETVTDNPVIAVGSFQLASVSGDSFTLADADGQTFKWDSVGSAGQTFSVSSGKLNLIWPPTFGGLHGLFTSATVSGALDVRATITKVTTDGYLVFGLFQNEASYGAVGQNGIMYYWSNNGRIIAYHSANGALTAIGDQTTPNIITDLHLRMTASGTAVAWSYSTDGITWTPDESETFGAMPAGVHVEFGAETNGAGSSWTVDDYSLSTGTVGAGGYRASGNWKSVGQTATAELFNNITVAYTGASASTYITAVSLIDGTGAYKYTDNTDLTAGTTHTYAVPNAAVSGSWKVQVNLTGGGAGTVNVQSVSVASVVSIPAPPPGQGIVNVVGTVTNLLAVMIGFTAIILIFTFLPSFLVGRIQKGFRLDKK
jgi:hypothetical protein